MINQILTIVILLNGVVLCTQSFPTKSRWGNYSLLSKAAPKHVNSVFSKSAQFEKKSDFLALLKAAPFNDTPYNEMTFLTAHNAHASKAYGWVYRQQNITYTQMLDTYGVRGIMLDVHPYKNDAYLCHGSCQVVSKFQRSAFDLVRSLFRDTNYQKLSDALNEIKIWINKNKTEVVTIFLENYVDDALIQDVLKNTIKDYIFTADDLASYREKNKKEDWPTLGYLRKNNKRIICFNEKKAGSLQQDATSRLFFDTYDHIIESNFGSTEEGICLQRAESAKNSNIPRYLYLFNFFSYPSQESDAKINNSKASLIRAFRRCSASHADSNAIVVPQDKKPNFIALDFVDIGDGAEIVKILNEKTLAEVLLEEYGTNKEFQAPAPGAASAQPSKNLSFWARMYNALKKSYNNLVKK